MPLKKKVADRKLWRGHHAADANLYKYEIFARNLRETGALDGKE